jgi:hypothetical protein
MGRRISPHVDARRYQLDRVTLLVFLNRALDSPSLYTERGLGGEVSLTPIVASALPPAP